MEPSKPESGVVAAGWRRYQRWAVWIAAVLIAAGGWIGRRSLAHQDPAVDSFWKTGKPAAIAVHGGRTIVRVPTPSPGSEVLVVVSALARSRGPFQIRLSARPTSAASVPELADDGPVDAPATAAAVPVERSDLAPSSGLPARERVFHLMVRDGDAGSSSNYTPVRGLLAGVGREVEIYVAAEDLEQVSQDLIKDLVVTFDDKIHPLVSRRLGTARDVDGNGRFTILLSSWLDHLGGGRFPVDGFVRVADLDPAYGSPLGNRCDMMYLNAKLKRGPHVRTVMAHEYMHAVVFSEKTLGGVQGRRHGLEEEGWLDEAIAHLAEDLSGFSTSNIDYRVSAFLTRPENYQLVVDDYYAADLFRSHGSRGSTYLFLRWCVDRYGSGLLESLVHSPFSGVQNLEAGTGLKFAALYRRWSLALFLCGLEREHKPGVAGDDGFVSINVRAPYDDWELAGPRFTRVKPDGRPDHWAALGTSSHFAVVESSLSGAVEIEVDGPPAGELQVSVVPLAADLPCVDLTVAQVHGPRGELRLRARINERNGVPVRLSALSWEPVTPSPHANGAGFRCGRLDMLGLAAAFGTSALPGGGEFCSTLIPMPGVSRDVGPLAVKVVGTNEQGRRIAAWAQIEIETPGSESEP